MGNAKSKVGPGETNPQQESIEADVTVFVQEKKENGDDNNNKNLTGKEIFGPYYEEAVRLHNLNPKYYPDPDTCRIVQGEELEQMRKQYKKMTSRKKLPKGHHTKGLAFGGENEKENITHTGESTIQRKKLTEAQEQEYIKGGYTDKEDYKIAKIKEDPKGKIIVNGKRYSFGLNEEHTKATNFQNKVLKWQREAGLRN